MQPTPLFAFVGTPIGNLSDISKRAIDALTASDTVFAEDTQKAMGLFNKFGLKKKIVSYHKDNEKSMIHKIISELEAGKRCVLISEAGMPCISDPGSIAAKALIDNNIPFEVISGPTALIQALIYSGKSGGGFYFHGFPPHKNSEKRKLFEKLKNMDSPIIFYESPHRIKETTSMLLEYFHPPISLSREMTKIYEETIFINTPDDVENIMEKGEFAIVVSPIPKNDDEEKIGFDIQTFVSNLRNENFSAQDMVKILKAVGIKRNIAYKMANGETE